MTKIVFTVSVMDLFHEGHANLLREMRKRGDLVLVVLHEGFTIFRNKKKFPIETLEKRTRNLINTGLVDIIKYTYEEEPITAFKHILERYKDYELLFVRGDDWKEFPGKKVLEENNVPIEYVAYTEGISSTDKRGLLNKNIHKNPVVENFRERAHKDIRDIDEILTQNGVEYFLSAGTMLGAVREGDFIEYDWDVDLCSMNFPDVDTRLKIHSDFRLKGFKVEPDEGKQSGRLKLERNVKTDIHFFEEEGRLAMCRRLGNKPLFSIPLKYIVFSKAKLGDFEYNVISTDYLDSVYKDWRRPMKDDYFNDNYYYFETQ